MSAAEPGEVSDDAQGDTLDLGSEPRQPQPETPDAHARLGRYALLDVLGSGGMGVVYRAFDPGLSREVALKVLSRGAHADEHSRQRFMREARAVAKLRSPNIVEVYEAGEVDGLLYFTMRLVDGPNLAQRLAHEKLPPLEAARVIALLARALGLAHQRGVLHRDVKPSNVLLDADGTPLLTDFGVTWDSSAEPITQTGQVLGTPAYMSPEQARGDLAAVGPAGDQFSLGVVLYELCSGVSPFQHETPQGALLRVLAGQAPALRTVGVPPALSAICQQAMSPEISARYANMEAFAADLERFLTGARPEAARLRWPRMTRRRAVATGIGLIALVAAGSTVIDTRLDARAADARWEATERRLIALEGNGEKTDADEVFDAYVSSTPADQATPLSRAWRARAEVMESRGDDHEAIRALGMAFAVAGPSPAGWEALERMVVLQRRERDWAGLSAALNLIPSDAPGTLELQSARRDLALATGDDDGAAALTVDPDQTALLASIRQVTRTPHNVETAAVDASTRQIWLAGPAPEGVSLVSMDDLAGPVLASVARPPGERLHVVGGPRPLAVLEREGERCEVVVSEGGTLGTLGTIPCTHFLRGARPPAGDQGPDLVVSDFRSLLGWTFHQGVGVARDLERSLSASNSEIRDLEWADLDGDAQPELLTGTAGWRAYDLRVYEGPPDALRLRQRIRLGEVEAVAVARGPEGLLVAAWQTHDPTVPMGPLVFGERGPFGEAAGLHLFRSEGGVLRPAGFIPAPRNARIMGRAEALFAADLSGDGLDELILRVDQTTVVYQRRPDGGWEDLTLLDLAPLAAAQLDADPAYELLARAGTDGHLVALGVGSDTRSRVVLDIPGETPPPAWVSGPLAARWRLVETLVTLGLGDAAADRLRTLAQQVPEQPAEGALLVRAGALLERDAQWDAAIEAYEQATSSEPILAWEGLLRAALATGQVALAGHAAEARLALPDPPDGLVARAAALNTWLAVRPLHADFSQGASGGWRVEDAVAVRWDGTLQGLMLSGAGEAPLLSQEVRVNGALVSMEVDLTMVEQRWGGLWLLDLGGASLDWSIRSFRWSRTGGGGLIQSTVRCPGMDRGASLVVPSKLETARLQVRWLWWPDERLVSCSLLRDDQILGQYVNPYQEAPFLSDQHPVISLRPGPGGEATGRMVVHTITSRGLQPVNRAAGEWEEAGRALHSGRPEVALTLLRGAPEDQDRTWLARAVALATLGRSMEATAALREAWRLDPERRGAVPRSIGLHLDPLEGALRSMLGAGWMDELQTWWLTPLMSQPRGSAIERLLLDHLDGVERWPSAASALMLARRAGLLRGLGRSTEGRSDLDQAEQMLSTLDPRSEADPTVVANAVAVVGFERATLELQQGDPDRAMGALLDALTRSLAPEVLADQIAASDELGLLHSHARWPAVSRASQGVGP